LGATGVKAESKYVSEIEPGRDLFLEQITASFTKTVP